MHKINFHQIENAESYPNQSKQTHVQLHLIYQHAPNNLKTYSNSFLLPFGRLDFGTFRRTDAVVLLLIQVDEAEAELASAPVLKEIKIRKNLKLLNFRLKAH